MAGAGRATHEYAIGIGYHLDGRVAEVFASDLKVGSSMRSLLEDACVIMSIALQLGIPSKLPRTV